MSDPLQPDTHWLTNLLALLGGLGVVVIGVITLWAKLRHSRHQKQKEQITDELRLNDRLKTTEMMIGQISDQSGELRALLRNLVVEVQTIRTKCVAHQHELAINDAKQDLKRSADRIEIILEALRTQYVQVNVHYSDMALINNAVDALREQTNETNKNLLTLLAKRR